MPNSSREGGGGVVVFLKIISFRPPGHEHKVGMWQYFCRLCVESYHSL